MPIDTLVLDLLDEVASGKTPEDACAGHPELLEEVRERLARLAQVRDDLTALFPGPDTPRVAFAPTPTSSSPEIPGHVVESILGRGGMGVVYKARHLRLNRHVAVKMMLNGGHAGPSELSRFLREAESLAAVGHPNIVQVHEVGDLDGLPYFTMEYVEGGTLSHRIGGVPLPAERAATLLTTLAGAVQAAHRVGIVHRDLKPANILIGRDGTPKVTDFGLAWKFDAGDGLTRTGARIGTPSYMAPEQAAGRPAAFGPATDIYALGAILYEMLTGRPPFLAESASETERQVIHEDPAPPTRLNSHVPRDLETICLVCLRKEPQRRYASATALEEDLRRFLRGEPIAARPAGVVERAGKWARRHPARAASIAGVAVITTALLALGWWRLAERSAMVRLAESDLQEAAAALRSSSWPEARSALERATMRIDLAGSGGLRRDLERSWGDLNLAETLETIRLQAADSGQADFDRSRTDRAYLAAFRDAGLCEPGDPGAPAPSLVVRSDIRAALVAAIDAWAGCTGDPERRRDLLECAHRSDPSPRTEWRTRARDPDAWRDPGALLALAHNARFGDESVPLLLNIALLLDATSGDGVAILRRIQAAHPGDFWVNFTLAQALSERRDPDAAGFYFAALAVRPRSAGALVNLGLALTHEGRTQDALECFRRAVEVRPDSATVRCYLANALFQSAEYEAAAAHCREALRIDPNGREAVGLMGVILEHDGAYAEARSYFARAIGLYPDGSPERALGLAYLGLCDRAIALEPRLPAIARGSDRWADVGEAVVCARVLLRRRHYGAAARLYAEAFAESAGAVDDALPNDRNLAALAAAAAGCGMGVDALELDEQERAKRRSWARDWLEDEREAQARLVRCGGQTGRTAIRALRALAGESGLAGVREEQGLSTLPDGEAREWRSFWRSIAPLTAPDPAEAIARSRDLAARGDWEWAAEGYAHAIAMEPTDDGELWFEYAAVELLAGNLEGYRRACQAMLDRCKVTPEMRPYHAARACTLGMGPEDGATLSRASSLAGSELRDGGPASWSLTEQGALMQRAGRSGDAIPLLEQSLRAESSAGTAVLNWLWLALAHRQLGQGDLADRWASMAENWLDRQGDTMPSDAEDGGLHLHNWLEFHALRQQAGTVLAVSGGNG